MREIINSLFEPIGRKKGYFIFLILLTILAVILGVFASINFSKGFLTIDLGNISYIKFLKGDMGMVSMIFSTLLSLLIFYFIVWACHAKPISAILSVIFYLYLVYSQTVILISLIMIYGFFNCIILAMLLLIYILTCWFIFLLSICHLSCICNAPDYFKCSFDTKQCQFLICLILLVVVTLIFSFTITILKNFIILLVY